MATAFAEFQTVAVANLTTCKSRSEEKTYKRPTFRSQAKCLWKSISHSILQAHRTAATSLLTTTRRLPLHSVETNSNNGRRAKRWQLGTLCALDLTRSVCSSSHSPCCICSGSREGPPCGLVSGQPETFRAKQKNSNYASWLYSLSFFSFFTLFLTPPFLSPSLSLFLFQVHSNCLGSDRISVFLLRLIISHLSSHSLLQLRCSSTLSEMPLGRADFSFFFFFAMAGLRQGAQGERKVFLQHMLVRCGAGERSQ